MMLDLDELEGARLDEGGAEATTPPSIHRADASVLELASPAVQTTNGRRAIREAAASPARAVVQPP